MFYPNDRIRNDAAALLNLGEGPFSQDWEIEVGSVELVGEFSRRDLVDELAAKDLASSDAEILGCVLLILFSSIDEALVAESHALDELISILSAFIYRLRDENIFSKVDLAGSLLYWTKHFETPDPILKEYQTGSRAVAAVLRELQATIGRNASRLRGNTAHER